MMMLWKGKKELVLLIDPNKKRFLTINSFNNKKVKRETNFFFFKKYLKTYSQTLFSIFLSVPERKNKTKNQWQLCFSMVEKNAKKKYFFFLTVDIFGVFFDYWNYFFDGWNFWCFFLIVEIIFSMVEIFDVYFWWLKLFFQ